MDDDPDHQKGKDGAKGGILVVFVSVALSLVYVDLLTGSFGCNSNNSEHGADASVDAPGAAPVDAALVDAGPVDAAPHYPDASAPDASTDSGMDATVTDATTDAADAAQASESGAPDAGPGSGPPVVFINGWQCASEANCTGDAGRAGWACCVAGAGYPATCAPAASPGPQTCGSILLCDPSRSGSDCYDWTGGGEMQCLALTGMSAPTTDGGIPLYQCGN